MNRADIIWEYMSRYCFNHTHKRKKKHILNNLPIPISERQFRMIFSEWRNEGLACSDNDGYWIIDPDGGDTELASVIIAHTAYIRKKLQSLRPVQRIRKRFIEKVQKQLEFEECNGKTVY